MKVYFLTISAFFFLFLFLMLSGCWFRFHESGEKVFAQERCNLCHTLPLASLNGKLSKDWHYAHLWDPTLVVFNSKMTRFQKEFVVRDLVISDKTFVAPSGQVTYGFKGLHGNSKELVYYFLSNTNWPTLPPGLKAFSSEPPGQGKPNRLPVAWIPPMLAWHVKSGDHVSLIEPSRKLKALTDFLLSQPQEKEEQWLGVRLSSPPNLVSKQLLKEGASAYQENCAVCHGIYGDGNGPASLFLYPKPRDLTSGEYKFKTTLSNELPADADLFRTLTFGMNGTSMPSWKKMSMRTRWALVAYIKTLAVDRHSGKNLFKKRPPKHFAPVHLPLMDSKVFSLRANRGEKLFLGKASCTDCHGPGAKSLDSLPHGDGPSASVSMDDWGYPVPPADLANGTLKRGNDLRGMYLTITLGMPGTPMPPYQNSLTDEERWDLACYVSKLRQKFK